MGCDFGYKRESQSGMSWAANEGDKRCDPNWLWVLLTQGPTMGKWAKIINMQFMKKCMCEVIGEIGGCGSIRLVKRVSKN